MMVCETSRGKAFADSLSSAGPREDYLLIFESLSRGEATHLTEERRGVSLS